MTRITFTDATGEGVEVETDLSGMVLTLANDASKAATTADIMAAHRRFHVGVDPSTGPGTSVTYVVDAGDVVDDPADDPAVITVRPVTIGPFRDNRMSYWDVAPPKVADLYPSSDPNEGRQAPPPRREWWAGSAPDAPPPGYRWMDCRHKQQTKQKMSKRKAQKLARKANRSK